MIDLGDRRTGDDFSFMFTTYGQTGSPQNAIASPAINIGCYRGFGNGVAASDDENITGFSQPAIHDSRPGLYRVDVDMDDNPGDVTFFVAGHDYFFVVREGTVDNVDLEGICIATFSIANRATLPFVGIDGTVDDETTPSGTAFSCTGVAGNKALNFYENQTVLFTSGTLKGLAHFITESTDDAIVELTVQEMPNAPVVGDTFVILGTKGS